MTQPDPQVDAIERVVGGILRRDNRLLLCLRSRTRKHYPGAWDVPGGHVADGETFEHALVRELHEELGIDARVATTSLLSIEQVQNVEFHLYVVDDWDGVIRNCAPDEHEELRWISLNDLSQLPLAHPRYGKLLAEALALSK